MDSELLRQCETRLREMREALASLDNIRKAGSAVVELDQTRTGRLSRIDALQLQAMANAGRDRAAQEQRRIDAALARIRSGTYGKCTDCGEPIASGRVQAQPAAALCMPCAADRERQP
ncbi:MAG: TraR/DksA family transcriptional regulator [Woeseia sp.]